MSRTYTTMNPTTEETLTEYTLMSHDEVRDAIARCHRAFGDWSQRSPSERAPVIRAIGAQLRRERVKLAELMTLEMGKPLAQGYDEIELCADICEYTAEHGPDSLRTEERQIASGKRGKVAYRPLGIVYGIQPWNFPAYQVVRYSIASLMAGNAVLLKHAENVWGCARLLGEIYENAGLPEHLFTVLYIDHDQSDEVIAHPHVRGVTFTGSPKGGRAVAEVAARNLKKQVLELGSNDAYIVLGDADLDTAIAACVQGRTANNGETCIAAKRFIVVDSRYEEFRTRFVEAMKRLKMGDPNKDDTNIGPMARKDLRDTLHEQVTQSVKNGARVLCGGEIPEGRGYFYPATVLDHVQPGQPAYDDELFGPVASLIRATDDSDALRVANDSRFGLGGAVFSRDESRAIELAEKHFDTGMVFINGFGLATPNMPFGGVKDSGYGREHGGFGLREFVNAKAIIVME